MGVIHGEGHERGMRSGTLNVPGIIGMAEALRLSCESLHEESERLTGLRNDLLGGLRQGLSRLELNGHAEHRLPGNLNVYLPGVESRALVLALGDAVSLSTGSACTTAVVEPSHVLMALGLGEARAHESVRFGLGRFTSADDVDLVVERVTQEARRASALAAQPL